MHEVVFDILITSARRRLHFPPLLGPFYRAIAVPSVTRCRCRRRRRCCCGHRRAAVRSGEWAQHFFKCFLLYIIMNIHVHKAQNSIATQKHSAISSIPTQN